MTAVLGRERELAVAEAFLGFDAERSRVLLLEGEAGVGKTTLWLAAVQRARRAWPPSARRMRAHLTYSRGVREPSKGARQDDGRPCTAGGKCFASLENLRRDRRVQSSSVRCILHLVASFVPGVNVVRMGV